MAGDWTQTWRQATVTGNREAGRGCRLLRVAMVLERQAPVSDSPQDMMSCGVPAATTAPP